MKAIHAIDWIAVDWGTSNVRVWALSADHQILASTTSPHGVQVLSPDAFEPTLLSLIADWLPEKTISVFICGMAGSAQGWQQVPYRATPCSVLPQYVSVIAKDPRLQVYMVAGICQHQPADVMRGEETQIAGLVADMPHFDGVVVLPGTHSKWVRVTRGVITGFTTSMTGELFALLRHDSILRHSTGNWSDTEFLSSVIETLQSENTILNRLFQIRAQHLLHGNTTGVATLSGILIGTELASMDQSWNQLPVILAGEESLTRLYQIAFQQFGKEVDCVGNEVATLAGLQSLYQELQPCRVAS